MKCPKCGSLDDRVIDSRLLREGTSIRRRRECLTCGHRYTTYENIEQEEIRVIKSDGHYEPFNPEKILNGILRACHKRPVSREKIDAILANIVAQLEQQYGNEIPSRAIGEKVMAALRTLDEVAYVRFASVYRRFEDLGAFEDEIKNVRESKKPYDSPS